VLRREVFRARVYVAWLWHALTDKSRRLRKTQSLRLLGVMFGEVFRPGRRRNVRGAVFGAPSRPIRPIGSGDNSVRYLGEECTMNTQEKIRLPGFTAESSVLSASPFRARNSFSPNLGAGVESAGSDVTCNCGCPCGGTTGGTGGGTPPPPPNPGVCNCSSVLGIGCSVSANHCNPGFVPQCDCGAFGNSCQCVAGT